MKKRFFRDLLACVLLLVMIPCAVYAEAPDSSTDSTCQHVWGSEETVAASCTANGLRTYTCTLCGDSYEEAIPATAHERVTIKGSPATCTAGGLTDGAKCAVCGEILAEQQEIPVAEHAWDSGTVVKNPSFTEAGEMVYTCTVCGAVKTEKLEKLVNLDTPVLTKVYNTSDGVMIKWKAVENAAQYRVFRKNPKGGWIGLGITTDTSFDATGLKAGTKYTFTVRCIDKTGQNYTSSFDATGKSIIYNPITGKTRIYLSPSDQTKNAYAYGNTNEAAQCNRIADALEIALRRCGFDVINNQKEDAMEERVEESNDWQANLHMPLHTNAFNGEVSGTRIFTSGTSGEDYRCAQKVYAYLAPLTPGTSESISVYNDLYEIKKTTAPSVYVESEFHDVPSVAKWIINHTTDIGEAICHGICDYFGVDYVTDMPVINSVSNSAKGVTVKWDAVAGAAQYRVFRKNPDGGWIGLGNTTSTSFEATGLDSGVEYTFTVRCVSADGKRYTSSYDADGKSIFYVAAPSITSVSNSAKGVTVKWDAVAGAAQYRVFRKGSGSWIGLGDTTSTSFEATGLTAGTQYTFTVRCLSDDGARFTSGYDAAGKSITYMVTPMITSVSNSAGGVTVKWNAVAGAAQYRVFRKNPNGGWIGLGNTKTTSFDAVGLDSGTEYTFTVRCVSADGKSYTSDYDTVGKSIMYIAAPSITDVKNSEKGVTVTWNTVDGAVLYRVFRKNPNGGWINLGNTTSANFTVTGLTSGTKYTFTVRCVSEDGKDFLSGYDATGKSILYLAQPTVTVANSASGVVVKWNKISGATGYYVYRKTPDSGWKIIDKITNNTTVDYTDTDAQSGQLYQYTVRARAGDILSSYQNGVQMVRLARHTIASLSNSSAGAVTVTWNRNANATGYQVYYKIGDTAKTVTIKSNTTISTVIENLTKGGTYTIYVRGYQSLGGVNYYSCWSAAKTVKITK